jgi:LysR family transcriptional regulator (chromosome initiation inhibitor)
MSLLSPQLEAFVIITQEGTVHGAAKILKLTQTAVTQRIRTLEKKLQTSLFVRTRRGMELTPEGEALLRYCQAAKDLEGDALTQIKGTAIETNVEICITGPSSIMHSRVVPRCITVLKQFPRLLMHFLINDVENRNLSLRTGQAQFAILQLEQLEPEMIKKILQPQKYVMVCTPQWKKRSLQDIISNERVIDFDPTDQMTFDYLKHFQLFKQAKQSRHYANNIRLLAEMIQQGLGYGVLTKEFAAPYVERGELIILNHGKIYENHIALAWYNRPNPPPYFTALIEAIE